LFFSSNEECVPFYSQIQNRLYPCLSRNTKQYFSSKKDPEFQMLIILKLWKRIPKSKVSRRWLLGNCRRSLNFNWLLSISRFHSILNENFPSPKNYFFRGLCIRYVGSVTWKWLRSFQRRPIYFFIIGSINFFSIYYIFVQSIDLVVHGV
jgi:hypothetical protein